MSDGARVLFEAHRASVEKHTYFLLACAGAAIGFAVTRTSDAALTWPMSLWAVAVAAWGISFYFGCRHVIRVQSGLWANSELLRVKAGEHPDAGNHPQVIAIASAGILQSLNDHSEKAMFYARWQFRSLVAGGVIYVVWHVLQMYLRSKSG